MARVFTGPNGYALKKSLNDTKAEFIKNYGDLAVEVIDGDEAAYERIAAAVESVPFLAEKKLVIVYDLGANKQAAEQIEQLLAKAESGNELIIIEPKPDKRSAYYKFLKKNTEMDEFAELDENGLANWLQGEADSRSVKLGFGDAYYLVQRVGSNQELAANELKKLIDYGGEISKETIDKLSEANPQTTIFNLLDSVFSGNLDKALRIYDEQRIQGEEPLKIFGLIIWQMHLVALIDSAGNRSDAEIMKSGGIQQYSLNKTRSIARRMGSERIKKTLSKMVALDKQLKTTSVDPDDALKSLLIAIS